MTFGEIHPEDIYPHYEGEARILPFYEIRVGFCPEQVVTGIGKPTTFLSYGEVTESHGSGTRHVGTKQKGRAPNRLIEPCRLAGSR